MKEFLGKDFLLSSVLAENLYQDYACQTPIFDYHCHLSVAEILENKIFSDLGEVWLAADHYKWRAMRSCGVEEHYITGAASSWEKFQKWAAILPSLIGNPLYHWAHLELRRFFNIDTVLNKETAAEIWEQSQALLKTADFRARSLIQRSAVWALCSTDDPCDDLLNHSTLQSSFAVGVFPTFRPDRFLKIEQPSFIEAVAELAAASMMSIGNYEDLKQALSQRFEVFHQHGCRLADHALDSWVFLDCETPKAAEIFDRASKQERLSKEEIAQFQSHLLCFLAAEYKKRDWVMQLHFYALRNANQLAYQRHGADSGFDAVYNHNRVIDIASFFDQLTLTSSLPRTILYSLNPNDTKLLMPLIGCFQQAGCPGYIQLGSAWWFNDTISGMQEQLITLAEGGNLGGFVGMLTDSRSFLSYPRHEYFRRIFCNLLAQWVEQGLLPFDKILLKKVIDDVCFNNVWKYINLPWSPPDHISS